MRVLLFTAAIVILTIGLVGLTYSVSSSGFLLSVGNVSNGLNAPISVSQVNLANGGQASGTYLVNTYWNIVAPVTTPQQVVLVLGGSCSSSNCASTGLSGTFNGQSFTATSQLFVTLTPGQPIAWVNLASQPVTFLTGASGYGCRGTGIGNCGSQFTTGSLTTNIFTSGGGAAWQYRFPISVCVTKIGGNDPFSNQCKSIDAFSQTSITIANPNPSQSGENITINGLGALIGSEGLPSAQVSAYQPTAGGAWSVFAGGPSLFSGYQNYWFGSSGQSSGSGYPNPQGGFQTPGWNQTQVCGNSYAACGGNPIYYYQPIQAPNPPNNQLAVNNACANVNSVNQVCSTLLAGLNPIAWVQQTNGFTPYGESVGNGINVNSSTVQINLPTNVFKPIMQVLASTQLVNTVIYLNNNAPFSITSYQAPSTISNGQTGTITLQVQNQASFPAAALIQWTQSQNVISIQPGTLSVPPTGTMGPGQTLPAVFNIVGGCPQTPVTDTITFTVINGQGTGTQSIQVLINVPTSQSCTGGITTSTVTSATTTSTIGGCPTCTTSTTSSGGGGGFNATVLIQGFFAILTVAGGIMLPIGFILPPGRAGRR